MLSFILVEKMIFPLPSSGPLQTASRLWVELLPSSPSQCWVWLVGTCGGLKLSQSLVPMCISPPVSGRCYSLESSITSVSNNLPAPSSA